jgi:hypothetical protein
MTLLSLCNARHQAVEHQLQTCFGNRSGELMEITIQQIASYEWNVLPPNSKLQHRPENAAPEPSAGFRCFGLPGNAEAAGMKPRIDITTNGFSTSKSPRAE